VVLRATRALRAAQGQAVTLTRDAKDGVHVLRCPDRELGS
jgi:hypothetical protein